MSVTLPGVKGQKISCNEPSGDGKREGLVQSSDNTPILSHINNQGPDRTTLISPSESQDI